MQTRYKKITNGNFGSHAWHSTWCLPGRLILPLLWLAACEPATVPLERTVGLTISDIKAAQTDDGQNNKNGDQTTTREENPKPVKFDLPRSIIVIDDLNERQNRYPDQPLKDTDTVQQIDQKMLEQKTAKKIAAATAVMNSITWQFQAGKKETKVLAPVVPSDQEVFLREDALETAFALLPSQATSGIDEPAFEIPPKLDGAVRVGLLVPLSGKYAALGNEIRHSVEMALFTINSP